MVVMLIIPFPRRHRQLNNNRQRNIKSYKNEKGKQYNIINVSTNTNIHTNNWHT